MSTMPQWKAQQSTIDRQERVNWRQWSIARLNSTIFIRDGLPGGLLSQHMKQAQKGANHQISIPREVLSTDVTIN